MDRPVSRSCPALEARPRKEAGQHLPEECSPKEPSYTRPMGAGNQSCEQTGERRTARRANRVLLQKSNQASGFCAFFLSGATQSRLSLTSFVPVAFSRTIVATGFPSLSSGTTLTARYPAFAVTAFSVAACRLFFALAMASLCAFAADRASPSLISFVFVTLPVA